VEGPASLAVPTGGVVPALADDLAVLAGDAARRVSVALAPAAHGEVRDRVVMGHGDGGRAQAVHRYASECGRGRGGDRYEAHVPDRGVDRVIRLHLLGRDYLMDRRQCRYQRILCVQDRVFLTLESLLALPLSLRQLLQSDRRHVMFLAIERRYLVRARWLLRHVQPIEHYPDIGSGHPILQHRRVVEVGGGRSTLQSAEGDPADRTETISAGVTMAVGAPSLLLIRLGDGRAIGPAVDPAALRRIELKRLPSLAVVHGLVDRDGVRLGGARTELQTDIRQLVLLAEREG